VTLLRWPIRSDPVDSLPIIYGVQTRLNAAAAVHLYTPAQVTLSCGSDAPARKMDVRLIAATAGDLENAIEQIVLSVLRAAGRY
jgi:hypothetical protein